MPRREPAKEPKPSPRETIERVRAAAAPKLERAAADAGPKVEKAAQAAGTFLSTLRDRAKETARHFSEGYAEGSDGVDATPQTPAPRVTAEPTEGRPRPRPRPGPRAD